jgi:hypothetical protein
MIHVMYREVCEAEMEVSEEEVQGKGGPAGMVDNVNGSNTANTNAPVRRLDT